LRRVGHYQETAWTSHFLRTAQIFPPYKKATNSV